MAALPRGPAEDGAGQGMKRGGIRPLAGALSAWEPSGFKPLQTKDFGLHKAAPRETHGPGKNWKTSLLLNQRLRNLVDRPQVSQAFPAAASPFFRLGSSEFAHAQPHRKPDQGSHHRIRHRARPTGPQEHAGCTEEHARR